MGSKHSSQYTPIGGQDYVKGRVLGKGSFGKVYVVEHAVTGTYRVVKELHKGTILAKGANVFDLLKKEREYLSELKGSPFIVKCFAATQDDDYLYILLEFCSGGELAYHLSMTGTFTTDMICSYLAQIGVGLENLHHKHHIVHRDIKPENILLDPNGYCAIIDFNTAIKVENDDLVIQNPSHQYMGTMPYIAPEMLEGSDYNHKVDWWSLGVMAYEFAYGKRPFSARGDGSEKRKTLTSISKTKLSEILSDKVPAELNSLIRGLLRKNPAKRYGAKEFKNHKFFQNIDWNAVEAKEIPLSFKPRPDKVNFRPDANVDEVFGYSKPSKESLAPLTEEQQKSFEGWNWASEDQELPPPSPNLLAKYNKAKSRESMKETKSPK